MLEFTRVTAIDQVTTQWSVDVTAIAGIVGTLLGALGGAYVTWKAQMRRLEHEDRTRFHDRRLAVYADFNDACQKAVAAITSGASPELHLAAVVRIFEMLRLVASQSVSDPSTRVYRTVYGLATAPAANRPTLTSTYNVEMATLCSAMRAEIGVAPQK